MTRRSHLTAMRVLNGIDLDKLEEALRSVREQWLDAERRPLMGRRRARAIWRGGLRSTVRTGSGGRFEVDEGLEPKAGEITPTSVEYLIGSLAGCVLLTFVYLATLRGIEVSDAELAVEGELENVCNFLGLSDEGHPGFNRISMTLYVRSGADEARLKEVFEEALRRSPVYRTLESGTGLTASLKVFR
ncbi:MAG: OsmC family protein [Nitrososphaerota archaeon]